MTANPERYPGDWVETFFDTEAKPTQVLATHTITTHKTFIPPLEPVEPTRRTVMTSKKISKAKRQIGDQTTKGGLIGLMIYGLNAQGVDPMLISVCLCRLHQVCWLGHPQRWAILI
jgi:hypothetical protein